MLRQSLKTFCDTQIPPVTLHIAMLTTMVIKMITINKIMMTTIFSRKGKTCPFWIVSVGLSCSTFKDDNVKEKNYENDFQSEGNKLCFLLMVL